MKYVMTLFILLSGYVTQAQTPEKALEKRAREFHQTLLSPDKEVWKKFIQENYSQRLIDKNGMDKLMGMWTRMHGDFANSKIMSTTYKGKTLEMIVDGSMRATLTFTAEETSPYKFDRVGVLVGGQEGGGGSIAEDLMQQLLKAVQSNEATIDQFLATSIDKTKITDVSKVRAELVSMIKDFKNQDVMDANVNPDQAIFVVGSGDGKKRKKITLRLASNNDKIGVLEIVDVK